jgi:iron(III) transport system ATP-binding protein
VRDGRAHSVLGELPLEHPVADGPVRVLLRPEQLRLGAPAAGAVSARVHDVDFYGHDSRVRLDLAGGPSVSARLEGADVPTPGDEVSVVVRGAAVPFPVAGPARTASQPAAPVG